MSVNAPCCLWHLHCTSYAYTCVYYGGLQRPIYYGRLQWLLLQDSAARHNMTSTGHMVSSWSQLPIHTCTLYVSDITGTFLVSLNSVFCLLGPPVVPQDIELYELKLNCTLGVLCAWLYGQLRSSCRGLTSREGQLGKSPDRISV